MEREFNNGNNVNGILRKSSNVQVAAPSPPLDLLVFGYGCKLFRDDNKASEIDHGKHLIPWMGDNNLKIDRYDVRGALYDLTPFEPIPGGYGNRLDYLSADEQRAEQLCEEERYLFLYKNETDFLLEQEESSKRLGQQCGNSFKEVQLNYDDVSKNTDNRHETVGNSEESANNEDVEEAFKLPINFLVPPSIQLPTTMKQHAIIEKTARFIASHGVQMEILLKAKQCNNAQFEFLAQNSQLNPYYKYVTNAIKNDIYPNEESTIEVNEPNKTPECSIDITKEDNDIPAITIPVVKYMPSANCAYTQLISKIKGVPLTAVLDEKFNKLNSDSAMSTPKSNSSPPTDIVEKNNENESTISSFNTAHVEVLINSSTIQALAHYYSSNDEDDNNDNDDDVDAEVIPEPVLQFPLPTDNLKNIIDKTAIYVIKNGRQFEDTLRTKSSERFAFLLPDSKYYPYYMYKVTGDPDSASKEKKSRKAAEVAAALISKKGLNIEKTASPVSFSIKCKEDNSTTSIQTVLPQEASDDDDEDSFLPQRKKDNIENSRNMPEHVQKAIKMVEKNLMARNVATAFTTKSLQSNSNVLSVSNTFDESNSDLIVSSKTNRAQLKNSKVESERNAIYELQQQNRHKELKKAEEKVKDKLAQIAREKLGGLLSKEKQLQMERKRKAEAFLNHIKGTASIPKTSEKEKDDQVLADNTVSDDSECSVHSVPISYYGPEDKTDDETQSVPSQPTVICAPSSLGVVSMINSSSINKKIATISTTHSDDDVEVINESASTLRLPPVTKNLGKEKYQSPSRSRSRDNVQHLLKKRKYRAESSDSKSSSYSSNSDKFRSYTPKRDKSDRKSELSSRYSHSLKKKSKIKERSESANDKNKKSNNKRHRDYDSSKNDYHYNTDERHSSRYKQSSSSHRKHENKIYDRSRSYKSKEKVSRSYSER